VSVRRIRMDAGGAEALAPTFRAAAADGPAEAVAESLADVRARGDAAVVDAIRRFDAPGFGGASPVVDPEEMRAAADGLEPELRDAIAFAAEQVRLVAEASRPGDSEAVLPSGQSVRVRAVPVAAAGVYAPGGRAAYPSSLIMGVVPAQVAGVERIVVASPPGEDGLPNRGVLAAAEMLGVDQVIAAGGAAAIGAMAFGTETVDPVDVITGPGNPWVQEAKRQVFGLVGIDSVAGPSELVVLADDSADPAAIAADLLAQAEHGPDSQVVFVTDSAALVAAVDAEVRAQVARLPREAIATKALDFARLIVVPTLDEAFAISNAYGPEHLIVQLRDPRAWLPKITCAGSIFLGDYAPESLGDYCSGTNHVLPTGGAARAWSGVSVASFQRSISVQQVSREGLRAIGPCAVTMARAESLEAHAQAVVQRLEASA